MTGPTLYLSSSLDSTKGIKWRWKEIDIDIWRLWCQSNCSEKYEYDHDSEYVPYILHILRNAWHAVNGAFLLDCSFLLFPPVHRLRSTEPGSRDLENLPTQQTLLLSSLWKFVMCFILLFSELFITCSCPERKLWSINQRNM